MTELTDLLLDDSGDLMLGEHEDGEVDLVFWSGAETVLQAVITRLRVPLGSVWYNRRAGIDHEFLFFSRGLNRFIETLQPIARAAFRRAILETDGVVGFERQTIAGEQIEPDITFNIDRERRIVVPIIPCIEIDCDNSITRGLIPQEFGPAIKAGEGGTTLPPLETMEIIFHFPQGSFDRTNTVPQGGIFVRFDREVDTATLPNTILVGGASRALPAWQSQTGGSGFAYSVTMPEGYIADVEHVIDYSAARGVAGENLTGQAVYSFEPFEGIG